MPVLDAYGRAYSAPRKVARVGSGSTIAMGRFLSTADPVELRTPERRRATYDEMVRTDPYIAGVFSGIETALTRATWKVKPGIEPKDKRNPKPDEKRSAEIAELCGAVLYREEGETFGRGSWSLRSWAQRRREAITALWQGWSAWKVLDAPVMGKRVIRELLWLEPSSLDRWESENGVFLGITRQYREADGSWVRDQFIPAADLALFVPGAIGERYEGASMARPMFGAYMRKGFVQRCKMMAAQRSVGQPWMTRDTHRDGNDAAALEDRIEDFLQSVVSGSGVESAYVSLPNDTIKMGYLQQDATQIAKYDAMEHAENLSISHAGRDAGMLGETASGSRALGEVKQSVSYVVAHAFGEELADQESYGVFGVPGIIERVATWNYAAEKKLPWLEVSDVDPSEKTRNMPLLFEARKAGVVKDRPELEQMVLDRLGFNLPDEVFDESPEGIPPAPPILVNPAGGPSPAPTDQTPGRKRPGLVPKSDAAAVAAARRMTVRAGLRERMTSADWNVPIEAARQAGYGRQPTEFESAYVSLGVVASVMDRGRERMAGILRRAHRQMIADLADRGRAGKIGRDELGGLRRSRPKREAEMIRDLREQFLAVAAVARENADSALEAQRKPQSARVGLEAGVGPGISGDGVLPKGAAVPFGKGGVGALVDSRAGGWTVESLLGELAGEASTTASVSIDAVWQRLLTEGVGEYQRLARQGMSDADLWPALESFLQGLSESPLDRMARQDTTVAYAEGTDVAAKLAAASGEAFWAVRSEVLDDRTCGPCTQLDGMIFAIGSPGYEQGMPPAGCDGGENCRGIVIPISDTLAEGGE